MEKKREGKRGNWSGEQERDEGKKRKGGLAKHYQTIKISKMTGVIAQALYMVKDWDRKQYKGESS